MAIVVISRGVLNSPAHVQDLRTLVHRARQRRGVAGTVRLEMNLTVREQAKRSCHFLDAQAAMLARALQPLAAGNVRHHDSRRVSPMARVHWLLVSDRAGRGAVVDSFCFIDIRLHKPRGYRIARFTEVQRYRRHEVATDIRRCRKLSKRRMRRIGPGIDRHDECIPRRRGPGAIHVELVNLRLHA